LMLSVVLARLVRRYCGERQGFKSCTGNDAQVTPALISTRSKQAVCALQLNIHKNRHAYILIIAAVLVNLAVVCYAGASQGPPRTEAKRPPWTLRQCHAHSLSSFTANTLTTLQSITVLLTTTVFTPRWLAGIERHHPMNLTNLVLHTILTRNSICTATVILLRDGMSPRLHIVSTLPSTSFNVPWPYSTYSYRKNRELDTMDTMNISTNTEQANNSRTSYLS
jgi:hypothetical protein